MFLEGFYLNTWRPAKCGFFVSDIISGGPLGHLGQLYLPLGSNC